MLAVADWWLRIAGADLEVVAAAAAPATTTERTKMRIASFMVCNPFLDLDWQKTHLLYAEIIGNIEH